MYLAEKKNTDDLNNENPAFRQQNPDSDAACRHTVTEAECVVGKNDISHLKSLFLSADAHLPVDDEIKRSALNLLQEEIARKEVRIVSDRRKLWCMHMRYADKGMLLFHIFCCLLMLLFMQVMAWYEADRSLTLMLSMMLSGGLGSFSVLEVGKICFAKLAELSESCFFNVRQMAAFDMILSGVLSLTALIIVMLYAGAYWKIRLVQIGLYVLVPFIVTQCVCLGVLLTEIGRRTPWMVAGIGMFFSVFFATLSSSPRLYTQSALFIWGAAFALGTGILAVQIRTLFIQIGKGDILCTN